MKRVIVIGAGVAGLTCARQLHRAGIEVLLLEASDNVGGRVRSDVVDGYVLDRGFQVFFTAYPAARRQLDYHRLRLCRFEPGAILACGSTRQVVSDPLRDPGSAIPSMLASLVPFPDKWRTARLTAQLLAATDDPLTAGGDETTLDYLYRVGFSQRYIETFLRPFFAGIFLTDRLETSARAFRFDWRMLATGDTTVPERGMGQISQQLAEELFRDGRILLNTRVTALRFGSSGVCVGVESDREFRAADRVIVATPAPEAARLTGRELPTGAVGNITVYFGGDAPIQNSRKILLNANRQPFVNNAAAVSNVSRAYAPAGKHLLAASVVGTPDLTETEIVRRAVHDLRRMLVGDRTALAVLETYRFLKMYRLPYAQFAQPPGIYERLPGNDSGIPGLIFAAEFTRASSINGAMESGENAANLTMTQLTTSAHSA
ncbi:MAG: NAD(P)/FAD-dependent oxidoreductase [Capsulimonadales bacterium]|nr:NAD(P)/FAD-dependent oxidoreductase [Capsulimonadales bacterium]